MKYAVAKKCVTEPKYSIDGKRHVHTNYYGGSIASPLGAITNWGRKKDAILFDEYYQAARYAKAFNAEVKEIK